MSTSVLNCVKFVFHTCVCVFSMNTKLGAFFFETARRTPMKSTHNKRKKHFHKTRIFQEVANTTEEVLRDYTGSYDEFRAPV